MSTFTTKDGTQIDYNDWGQSQPRLIKRPMLKIDPGTPHGLTTTHKRELNAAFIKA